MHPVWRAPRRWWPAALLPASFFFFLLFGWITAVGMLLVAVVACFVTLLVWHGLAFVGARFLVRFRWPWEPRAARVYVRLAREPAGSASIRPREVLRHALLPFALALALGSVVASWVSGWMDADPEGVTMENLSAVFLLTALFGGAVVSVLAPMAWILTLSHVRRIDGETGATDRLAVPPVLTRFTWITAILAIVELTTVAPVQDALQRGIVATVAVVFSLFLVYPLAVFTTFLYFVLLLDGDLERLHRALGVREIPDVYAWKAQATAPAAAGPAPAEPETPAPAPA